MIKIMRDKSEGSYEIYDFAHGRERASKINDALMDTHLETIPSLATLTTGGFTSSDAQRLGRHASRSAHLDALLGGLINDIAAG